MRRRLARTLTAAALLPIVLLALTATSFASWRCQHDGIARSACCCPGDMKVAQSDQATREPSIASRCCCDFERHHVQSAPSDVSRVQTGLAAPPIEVVALVASLTFFEQPAPASATFRFSDERPPGGGRSLVLRKHAFLI